MLLAIADAPQKHSAVERLGGSSPTTRITDAQPTGRISAVRLKRAFRQI